MSPKVSTFFLCSSRKVLEAKFSAEGIRLIGTAKATVLGALGAAEADGVSEMSEAFEHFTDASKLSSMLMVLPRLTAHVTQVLSNAKEVVLYRRIRSRR